MTRSGNDSGPRGHGFKSRHSDHHNEKPETARVSGFFVGVFRRGNKPPVQPGEEKGFSKAKMGELKASPRTLPKDKPPDIIAKVWRPHC